MNFINGQARDPNAPPPAAAAAGAVAGEAAGPPDGAGAPLLKPPYGTITGPI